MVTLFRSSHRGLKRGALGSSYQPFPDVTGRNTMQEALEVPLMVRLLKLPVDQKILEVGCGRGIALPVLAQLCKPRRLTGLDIAGDLLTKAAKRLAARQVQVELVQADVREMPFQDESFDIVIDFGTCYHIADPDRALSEIARVLSFGGTFVHETPANQVLSHPLRSFGRTIPWSASPLLMPQRTAVLWSSRVKR